MWLVYAYCGTIGRKFWPNGDNVLEVTVKLQSMMNKSYEEV